MKRALLKSHGPRPVPHTTRLRHQTIAMIGAGKMGQALLKGLLEHGVPRQRLRAADSSQVIRRRVERHVGIRVSRDNRAVIRGADVIILAVKPQQMDEVVRQLASSLVREQLVISIAAGMTLRWLQTRLRGIPVVRVMPNLPATVGSGFSAIALGEAATARHRALAMALFGAVGDVCEVPERQLDAVTAVSGSGPAYVFFFAQMWQEAARSLGLSPAVAERAIRSTLEGSVRLWQASGEPPEGLISRVASKGGTTEAALKVLVKRRVAAHFLEALRAAARRSKELSCSS